MNKVLICYKSHYFQSDSKVLDEGHAYLEGGTLTEEWLEKARAYIADEIKKNYPKQSSFGQVTFVSVTKLDG